jgi:hypothetical protein
MQLPSSEAMFTESIPAAANQKAEQGKAGWPRGKEK